MILLYTALVGTVLTGILLYWSHLTAQISEIIPGELYITNYATSMRVDKVKGFKKIICFNERRKPPHVLGMYKHLGITHVHFALRDSSGTQVECLFDSVYRQMRNSGKVLLHCTTGRSRAPAMAIMYMMRHYGLRYYPAYQYVKERRKVTKPNKSFRHALMRSEVDFLSAYISMFRHKR